MKISFYREVKGETRMCTKVWKRKSYRQSKRKEILRLCSLRLTIPVRLILWPISVKNRTPLSQINRYLSSKISTLEHRLAKWRTFSIRQPKFKNKVNKRRSVDLSTLYLTKRQLKITYARLDKIRGSSSSTE